MKKLGVWFIIAVVFLVMLVMLTFLYIHMSGHKSFTFKLYSDTKLVGETVVDRFVTEEKVIYKSSTSLLKTTEYPLIIEKLFLDRANKYPVKFEQEAIGPKKSKRVMLLTQNGETTDYLYLEPPKFFKTKDFPTGNKTSIFIPGDILTYMPIVNKYNFWKKGAQFFEVMIPLPENLPPLRDKIGVKFIEESFVPVMGKRVEADTLLIQAGSLYDITVVVAKHSKTILSIDIGNTKDRYVLADYEVTPAKKFMARVKESVVNSKIKFLVGEVTVEDPQVEVVSNEDKKGPAPEEVFFQGDEGVLSADLYLPEGQGKYPAVLFVPREGPGTKGEEFLASAIGEYLRSNEIIFLNFDSRTRSNGQIDTSGMEYDKNMKDINSAVSFLESHPGADTSSIYILGYKSGGHMALRASAENPKVNGCIVLGIPEGPHTTGVYYERTGDHINKLLDNNNLRQFENNFSDNVVKEVQNQESLLVREKEDFYFFMGRKIPAKNYKDMLCRKPYDLMGNYDKPLLFVFGKNDADFDSRVIGDVKRDLHHKKDKVKVEEVKGVGEYFGKMIEGQDGWVFAINEDMLTLVRDWVKAES